MRTIKAIAILSLVLSMGCTHKPAEKVPTKSRSTSDPSLSTTQSNRNHNSAQGKAPAIGKTPRPRGTLANPKAAGVGTGITAVDMRKTLACLALELPRKPIFVIRTKAQFSQLMNKYGSKCTTPIPPLGFPKKMLIGTVVRTGGCSVKVSSKVLKHKTGTVLKVQVRKYGLCERLAIIPVWKLISAIPAGAVVKAQIHEKQLAQRPAKKTP